MHLVADLCWGAVEGEGLLLLLDVGQRLRLAHGVSPTRAVALHKEPDTFRLVSPSLTLEASYAGNLEQAYCYQNTGGPMRASLSGHQNRPLPSMGTDRNFMMSQNSLELSEGGWCNMM